MDKAEGYYRYPRTLTLFKRIKVELSYLLPETYPEELRTFLCDLADNRLRVELFKSLKQENPELDLKRLVREGLPEDFEIPQETIPEVQRLSQDVFRQAELDILRTLAKPAMENFDARVRQEDLKSIREEPDNGDLDI